MTINYIFNILLYFTVIALYIIQPIIGALGQIGLGVFQFIYALTLINHNKTPNSVAKKALKIYWLLVIVWVLTTIITTTTSLSNSNDFFLALIYITPMTIGFYFLVVTYLFNKKTKSHEK